MKIQTPTRFFYQRSKKVQALTGVIVNFKGRVSQVKSRGESIVDGGESTREFRNLAGEGHRDDWGL